MSGTVYVDLETAGAEALFTGRVSESGGTRSVDGPFTRLCGAAREDGPVGITSDAGVLLGLLDRADKIVWHNGLGYDALVLARRHGADWDALAAKSTDTELAARQLDPPRARSTGGSLDRYTLDHVAERLGVQGKITGDGGLNELKRIFHGYDRIPVDDPRFRAYLRQDVTALRDVATHPRLVPVIESEYVRREHRLVSLAGRMTLNGFRVDEPLLRERIRAGQERKAAALAELNTRYGIPLDKEITRGRGSGKVTVTEPYASPLATRAGKDALIRALAECGAVHYPRTEKTKDIAAGRDGMEKIYAHYGDLPGLKRLCDLVTLVTTVRTVYQTAADHLTDGGRVHAMNSYRQASGRCSTTAPGLTVYGKHDGRHVERDIFVPEDGHVIITCDLSQADLRVIAGHCQDPAYMELFAPGRDAHMDMAEIYFGVRTPDARQKTKKINHQVNYGGGAESIARQEKLDLADVQRSLAARAAAYPRLIKWTEDVRDRAAAGDLLDNGFGRMLRCDPVRSYTQAPALMGQGGARDLLADGLLRLPDDLRPFLRAQVHDEIVLSVPEQDAGEVSRELEKAMTTEWMGVPILCQVSKPGGSWGEVSGKG